jgi:hypothetical protein
MLQRHYPVPVVVLRKICKIPLYSCNRHLIRRKTQTSEEEFEFWEEMVEAENFSDHPRTGWLKSYLTVDM